VIRCKVTAELENIDAGVANFADVGCQEEGSDCQAVVEGELADAPAKGLQDRVKLWRAEPVGEPLVAGLVEGGV